VFGFELVAGFCHGKLIRGGFKKVRLSVYSMPAELAR